MIFQNGPYSLKFFNEVLVLLNFLKKALYISTKFSIRSLLISFIIKSLQRNIQRPAGECKHPLTELFGQ